MWQNHPIFQPRRGEPPILGSVPSVWLMVNGKQLDTILQARGLLLTFTKRRVVPIRNSPIFPKFHSTLVPFSQIQNHIVMHI